MFFRARSQEPPAMTLEGVLGPNSRLDDADSLQADAPHALCVAGTGELLFSSGRTVQVLKRWSARPKQWAVFDAEVTALAADPSGMVAIGLAGGGLAVRDSAGRPVDGWDAVTGLHSVTDCAFASGDEIVVVDNGYGMQDDFMSVAPWDDKARGKVVSISRSGGSKVLASALHCPMGIAHDPSGAWIVSLFERALIVDLAGKVRQSGYPAYPGRIRRTDKGYVLACLARRDPLIEFLKTERAFVAEMKASMAPRHWISPRAKPEFSHDFPIEAGATRLFGEVKPWAPSFSYGLVIELDEKLMPVASAHSRANGQRHEITDALEWNGELVAVSRASGEIIKLGPGSRTG
ncbi:MAG: hypothetical protein VYD64_09780 [Pseudomonadota bacterium]|nr:hypothetical protein [Pseudomonadota bacterium]